MSLAELASKLPNSGGLAGWFAGENDMTAFGEQLVPFGEALKSYSLSVIFSPFSLYVLVYREGLEPPTFRL